MAQVVTEGISAASRMMVKAIVTEPFLIWLCRWPALPQATAMRTAETTDSCRQVWRSYHADRLCLRRGDVDSTINRRMRTTPTMPGFRTSMMATRTTTTSRMLVASACSADQYDDAHAESFSFTELVQAYHDCRKSKRNTPSALLFEQDLERNLIALRDKLRDGSYTPGRSICFVVTRPKAREVWAADFPDRIVHHLLHNKIFPRFNASFIQDSCACIPGRGTMYAAQRLDSKIRSITQNWSKPAFYLKCDLANFFVSIDKNILRDQIAARVMEPWWLSLAETILFHDPRLNYELRGPTALLALVPPHKRLAVQPPHLGLPIGNHSSQFFANIYLNALDQFAKHQIRARHYIRYVDDFILLHESAAWLNDALGRIEEFLGTQLHAKLNPTKTILQPIDRGVDFVGQVIKPWQRATRRRTINEAVSRISCMPAADVHASANSYFGLFRQSGSSHRDRTHLAKAVMRRGHTINTEFTKTYRKCS